GTARCPALDGSCPWQARSREVLLLPGFPDGVALRATTAGVSSVPEMKLAEQALALLLPSAPRRFEHRCVRRAVDPLLQLQHPSQLLCMADGAVDEKRAGVCGARHTGRRGRQVAARCAHGPIVHQILTRTPPPSPPP